MRSYEREEADTGVCPFCKEPEIRLVKISTQGRLTKTETTICRNRKCVLFINKRKIKTWKVKNKYHNYARDFATQNSPDYYPRWRK